MKYMFSTNWTVLFELHSVWCVCFIFCSHIVLCFTLCTHHCKWWSFIRCHISPFRSGGQTWTADLTIMSRALLPTELRRHKLILASEPSSGIEPETSSLPWKCSTNWAKRASAGRRIRTYVGIAGRFTVCSLWPLGHPGITIKSL